MTGIRILALVPYALDTTPSQRFRIEQWAPRLEGEGISVDFSPFFDRSATEILHSPGHLYRKMRAVLQGFRRRLSDLRVSRSYDWILIHRAAFVAGPASFDLSFYRRGVPVIFDFDDAIYLQDTSVGNPVFDRLKFPSKIASLCRESAVVTAGSQYLAAWASRHAKRVATVPTSIDVERYRRPDARPSSRKVVVGWTGSSTSLRYLEASAPLLRRLCERREIEIRVVANRRPLMPGLEVDWRPWSAQTEISEIAQFDIGIKPLPDDPWSRGKCPMKELQYMALEIPPVCSNVGATREAVSHSDNGFLVSDEEGWLDALTRLIDSPDLRRRMGRAGRVTV
jgi:glycosyltransferase involved in cell wall biosynthesis